MPEVEQTRGFRFSSTSSVICERGFHYSNTDVEVLRCHRYATLNSVATQGIFRYASAQAPDAALGPGEMAPWDLAWKCGIGDLTWSLTIWTPTDTYDISELAHTLEITLEESQLMQWSLSFTDPTGEFSPRKVGGDWEGVMDASAYDSSDNLIKLLIMNIEWGGMTEVFVGVPKHYGWTRVAPGKVDFVWSGSCVADKLFRKSATAPTLRTTSNGAQIFNDYALRDLFERVGLNADYSRVTRRPIRVQQRQNDQWIAFLTEILESAVWAEWRTEGSTVVCYQPAFGSKPQWTYDSTCLVPQEGFEGSSPDVCTQVSVRRAAEGGTTSAEPIAMQNFGTYSTTFNPPVNGLQYRLVNTGGGVLSDVIMRNKAGEVVAVRDVRGGVWPAIFGTTVGNAIAKVDWTWGAPPNFVGDGLPGSVEWTGAPDDREDTFGAAWDPVFQVEENDLVGQEKWGVRREELAPNPQLVSEAHAREYGIGYMRRKNRDADSQTLDVPLNHRIYPGHYYRFDDLQNNLVEDRYIKRVSHRISPGDGENQGSQITGVIY